MEKKDKLHADAQLAFSKPIGTRAKGSNSKDAKPASQSVTECWNHRIVSWPDNSMEYKQRQQSLVMMMLYTGLPMTTVTDQSFKDFVQTLDNN